MLRTSALMASTAVALMTLVGTAQAAPLNGSATALAAPESNFQQVDYRRCWWRHGVRYCRRVYDDDDDYGYRYSYGPAFGLSFGDGRFHGRHHFHSMHRR